MAARAEQIAEARKAQRAVFLVLGELVATDLSRIIGGLADALESAPPLVRVVLGRRVRHDHDLNWEITSWPPEDIEEARTQFPNSEYKLAWMEDL